MSFTSLNFLLVLGLFIWFWRENLRVRETATRIGRQACKSYGLQFLDQTVALQRLRPRWVQGLHLQRTYQFDYSLEGEGRRTGYLVMLGNQHLSLHLNLPQREGEEDREEMD